MLCPNNEGTVGNCVWMYQISLVCLWQESKRSDRPQALEALFKKPLFQAPQRLQRMMLRLQRYDLQVEYEPGKNLFIADTLSRAPEVSNETTGNKKDEFEVLTLENLPVSEVKLEQFKDATRKDLTLQKLKTTVISGCPQRKSQVDPELCEYWNINEEISV